MAAEAETLGRFRYSRNETVLHTDTEVLPRAEHAQASWNYRLPGCEPGAGAPVVTYDMNRLQSLNSRLDLCVTLNRDEAIDPERVLARFDYHHPIFDGPAIADLDRFLPRRDDVTGFL